MWPLSLEFQTSDRLDLICKLMLGKRGRKSSVMDNEAFRTEAGLQSAWWRSQMSGLWWWVWTEPETNPSTTQRFQKHREELKRLPAWLMSSLKSLSPHWRCSGWEPEWSALKLRGPTPASSGLETRPGYISETLRQQIWERIRGSRLKISFLLYWPRRQRRTPGSRWRLCCRPSPQAPPRSRAPASWYRPPRVLCWPGSPHLVPRDNKRPQHLGTENLHQSRTGVHNHLT